MGIVPVMMEKADQLINSGNSFLAKKLISEMLQHEPENPWVYIIRGKLHLTLKETDEARADLYTALRIEPENPAAFYLLARIEMEANDQVAGYGWICRALEQEPENPDFLGLKSILLLTGYEHLTDSWNVALDGLSKDPLNRTCLAAAYFSLIRLDREKEALDYLRIAMANYPEDPQFLSMFSKVLLKAGDRNEAREAILAALRKIPEAAYYQQQLESVELSTQSWYRYSIDGFLFLYKKFRKILVIIASLLWMIGLYSIVGHYHPLIHIGVLSCWIMGLILALPSWLYRVSLVIGYLTGSLKIRGRRRKKYMNLLFLLIGLFSIVAGIGSFFLIGDKIEVWLSLGCAGWILFYPAIRLQLDKEKRKAPRYIRHNIVCIFLSCLLLMSIILFPKAGYEIIYMGTIMVMAVFHWIRNRWEFNEKYDLSKTLTAHE